MKKINKLTYITYQTFPANTANSLQTITNIAEIVKQGVEVNLIFPGRDSAGSDNIDVIKDFYGIDEEFQIIKLKHRLPFGKIKYFNKIAYHLSHYIWSKKTVKTILSDSTNQYFLTRSDWIFYFLSKKNQNVIFECHQPSKLRSIILRICLTKKTSKIIFLNEYLYKYYKKFIKFESNSIILNNGFRDTLYSKKLEKINKHITFVGQLLRFGTSRNIEFIISCFDDSRLKEYTLNIVGGPNSYVEKLKKSRKLANNINFFGQLSNLDASKVLLESEIGLLINSSTNKHSIEFTSPLKYFEYLAADLKILAVDFKSHRSLPFASNILFFNENDKNSFIECVLSSKKIKPIEEKNYTEYSIQNRIKSLLNFARLEGLEPPTL
tara:strand:+ start:1214 stop:2353 length:1140 start_codon:yes stop_codon:yes gene_type:complete